MTLLSARIFGHQELLRVLLLPRESMLAPGAGVGDLGAASYRLQPSRSGSRIANPGQGSADARIRFRSQGSDFFSGNRAVACWGARLGGCGLRGPAFAFPPLQAAFTGGE